jgi:hypothetical protein
MTPEQTAREIVASGYIDGPLEDGSWLEMPASAMINTIAKAIAAEREACAKIADPIEHGGPWSDVEKQAYDVRAVIAAAIRARGRHEAKLERIAELEAALEDFAAIYRDVWGAEGKKDADVCEAFERAIVKHGRLRKGARE